jgi:hypothetical protein
VWVWRFVIVGRSFVWMHFPKTGGHTVAAAIRDAARGREDVVFDRAGADEHRWHNSIGERVAEDRSFDPSGKVVISGARRLPWWILSRVHYEAARPPHRCASREMLCRGEFYEQDGTVGRADDCLARLGSHPVDRWVRLEHLAEDFVGHFEALLGPRVRNAAHKLKKVVNPTALDYVKALDFHFTAAELDGLYAANPRWAAMERQVYGDILRL